jgi:hypothetical protein
MAGCCCAQDCSRRTADNRAGGRIAAMIAVIGIAAGVRVSRIGIPIRISGRIAVAIAVIAVWIRIIGVGIGRVKGAVPISVWIIADTHVTAAAIAPTTAVAISVAAISPAAVSAIPAAVATMPTAVPAVPASVASTAMAASGVGN